MRSHLYQAYDFDIRIRLYDYRTAHRGAVKPFPDMNGEWASRKAE